MKSDFEGLKDLLAVDVAKFLDDMKDTLIPMLDLGLDEKLKNDLIRSIHGLKAISGMFELHDTTEFITDTEIVIKKIFDLNRKDIANDLLNDMFEIKDQIQLLFKDFISPPESNIPQYNENGVLELRVPDRRKHISEKRKNQCKERLDEFNRHYVEYKLGKEVLAAPREEKQASVSSQTSTPSITPVAQNGAIDTPSVSKNTEVLYVHDDVMYFRPLSLKQEDVLAYQPKFVSSLDNVKQISIDMGETNKLDISGISFIQSIQKHCKVSGIKFIITAQSDLVKLEAGILGVEL